MKVNHLPSMARRAFMQRMGHLSLAGVAAPWALNLASAADAAASSTSDYKALVCVFLYGGNDHFNTIVPYDAVNHAKYAAIRAGIATPREMLTNTVLLPKTGMPGGMQMALAPEMLPLKSLFDAGKLAIQLNVGPLIEPTTPSQFYAQSVRLPPKLFSHNDQTSVWQSGSPEGAQSGWGGRLGDLALAGNSSSLFTCISVTGQAVFVSGEKAATYQLSPYGGAIPIYGVGNNSYGSALRKIISQPYENILENEYSKVTARSIGAESQINVALRDAPKLNAPFDASNPLAMQLQMVAKMIAARTALGLKRQVFMVALDGFDLHDGLPKLHPPLLAKLAGALASFYDATVELGISDQVTAFTASDFGRTLFTDGGGSQHGWGSHHFVMGGAVKGGNYFGTAPEMDLAGPSYVYGGRLVPTTSVDQYAATLAKWFGVSENDLGLISPSLHNFNEKTIGFI